MTRRPSRVLLVESDRATAEMYRVGLLMRGYDVDMARDGEDGLDQVLQGQIPDIVVVDLGLPRREPDRPRKDSLDMLATLRSIRITNVVPVLALTSDIGSMHDAMGRGATQCLVNWWTTPRDLTQKVAEILGEPADPKPGESSRI